MAGGDGKGTETAREVALRGELWVRNAGTQKRKRACNWGYGRMDMGRGHVACGVAKGARG